MKLRRFRPDGIAEFRAFLNRLRDGADESPEKLLKQETLTEVIVPETQIDPQPLATKGEAAHFLKDVLGHLERQTVRRDAGLWTWLTAVFFDSVCPLRGERRRVKHDSYYIFEPNNSRYTYRHLLFISWRILLLAPVHNRLFLTTRLDVLDTVTAEVTKRLYLTRIPCIFEVLDRLYWDPDRQRVRKGMTSTKTRAGDLNHRLPTRIRELEKTYDLQSLNADQLLELLGEEFSFARPGPRASVASANGLPPSDAEQERYREYQEEMSRNGLPCRPLQEWLDTYRRHSGLH